MIRLFRNISVDAECDSRTNISRLLEVGTFASSRQLKNVCLGTAHLKRLMPFHVQRGISRTSAIPWTVSNPRYRE